MNCEEFQKNVDGLARGALLDARVRDEAAAHEAACGACAARLADERALTAGLRALASKMSEASAPARAESALLSAFRSRAAAAASASAGETTAATFEGARDTRAAGASSNGADSNVVALSAQTGARHWSWVKTVGVAAMAAAAAAAFLMLVPPMPGPTPERASESAANRSNATALSQAGGQRAGAVQNETAQKIEEGLSTQQGGANPAALNVSGEERQAHALAPRRAPVRGMNASYDGRSNSPSSRGLAAETAAAEEVKTDFIPLMQGAAFSQSESTHLVRVELPRSALASFGIPVNAEQAGGRVKADVLLGEDGTARAIRFVR